MERQFLTVKEVALLLGVTPRTVYNMCWGKRIPHIMVGAGIRIHKDALRLLVEEGGRVAMALRRNPRGGGPRGNRLRGTGIRPPDKLKPDDETAA